MSRVPEKLLFLLYLNFPSYLPSFWCLKLAAEYHPQMPTWGPTQTFTELCLGPADRHYAFLLAVPPHHWA
jgi:hypothetical protein